MQCWEEEKEYFWSHSQTDPGKSAVALSGLVPYAVGDILPYDQYRSSEGVRD